MLKSSGSVIRLRGVRHNNLKIFDLELPLKQLIVITGLSGSGKSSLAFDTLFAEGQRRYIETFSPYARQFFDRMDKPQVDSIEGIPPAIAIEQRNAVRTTRSTVGTMTEICDYIKMAWPHIAQLHCRQCGSPVRKDSPTTIWNELLSQHATSGTEFLITFDLPLTEKLSFAESLALVGKQGYQRLLLDGKIVRLDEMAASTPTRAKRYSQITVIQDRLRLAESSRPRFVEACEQAYHFGKGKLAIHPLPISDDAVSRAQAFSRSLHCARCDIEYKEPSTALFSFNNPVGACPTCRGFGRSISIDYNRALPDRSKTLAGGVVRPWQTGHGLESQRDLLRMCREVEIPTDVAFEKLSKKWQELIIQGDPDYGKDEDHQWPRVWYGVKGYFRWLESKAYKMHVRVLLSRYRAYTICPECHGKRFQPEALLYSVQVPAGFEINVLTRLVNHGVRSGIRLTLADFYELPIKEALKFIEGIAIGRGTLTHDPVGLVLEEVRSRLAYLDQVGLGYLTLDRPTRSLSGGETERVNLTTCLGTRLVNTLFVLDEPSVGLHPRDTGRLVSILTELRKAGNTVVLVEHEASVMRAADQIVDLGPGHGATGGEVVFQGTYEAILRDKKSLTGQYLSGRKQIEIPQRRPVRKEPPCDLRSYPPARGSAEENALVLNDSRPVSLQEIKRSSTLSLRHATRHNLRDLSLSIPLEKFVCITGVSGSGKTTLIREVLLPVLQNKFKVSADSIKASDRLMEETSHVDSGAGPATATSDDAVIEGWETLRRVVTVDQSVLGKTPRSNAAVYIGAFDAIRECFAQSELAQQRGLSASAFSFNSTQGQCERCRGAGFEKIEMQFLSDVFIRCAECNGRRYRPHILTVKIQPQSDGVSGGRQIIRAARPQASTQSLSIADLLDSTVEEAIAFLSLFHGSTPALRAVESLRLLSEVGLGYLRLGQPLNTLSGGESQRLKLVRHLAESDVGAEPARTPIVAASRIKPGGALNCPRSTSENKDATLFLFDEPTTGLHFDDVRVLLRVFQRLVDSGHSVVVVEHNLDVIKSADWVIDLGPEGGLEGGQLVAEGTPEQIAACDASHTGIALRSVLPGRRSEKSSLRAA